jgi:hypothetical protein
MLPLKRAFVDISSTDESDDSIYNAPELHHADSIASFAQCQTTPTSPSICLGMVSSSLGSAVALLHVFSTTYQQLSVDTHPRVAPDRLTTF